MFQEGRVEKRGCLVHLLLIICVIESKRMGFYSFRRKAGALLLPLSASDI
jgi:hypothetical protein